MHGLRRNNRALSLKVKRMKLRISVAIENSSVILDDETSADVQKIMGEEESQILSQYPENSFHSIFWKTQIECMAKAGKMKKGIRWHPLIIKCTN